MTIEVVTIMPRIYINSFPKSGTHLALLITAHMARKQEPHHWLGTFKRNSWSTEWMDFETRTKPIILGQPKGTWMIGHCGYMPEIEEAFREMNTCVLFIYRDLRDVAVSQTHHIENPDDEVAKHPGKADFMDLPSHEARIQAVLEGLGPYNGLIERWELFAPWLECDWVIPIRFEDMINSPEKVARKTVNAIITQTTAPGDFPLVVAENYSWSIAQSVAHMADRSSPAVRKGKIGEWKKEFTPHLLDVFDRVGGNVWLERLGYYVE